MDFTRSSVDIRVSSGFLLELTEALLPLTDSAQIHAAVTHIMRQHLQADRCLYCEIDNSQVIIRQDAYRDGFTSMARVFQRTSFAAFNAAIDSGEPLVIENGWNSPMLGPDQRERFVAMQAVGAIAIPVVKEGVARGVLWVTQASPRTWTSYEVHLARLAAEHAWSAIERRKAEDALRDREQMLQALVDASSDAVWETDATGRLIRNSPKWLELTGQSIEDSLGDGWLDVVHPDDRERVDRVWRTALSGGQSAFTELRYSDHRGGHRWMTVRVVPIRDPDGRIKKWVGMSTDITAHRSMVSLKAANDSLLQADRRKDDFLAILEHELRNPLAAIRGATELLKHVQGRAPHLLNARQALERQTTHVAKVIDDLLDISRIEHGKIRLQLQTIDLCEVADAVVQDREQQARSRGLSLIYERPADALWICADRTRMVQVLDNLVGNSIKFTPEGGSVRVSLAAESSTALMVVQDTGIGIEPQKIASLFVPFQQDEGSGAHVAGGLGLGLALSKGLIALHGGAIEARSAGPGRGATFVVKVPRVAAA